MTTARKLIENRRARNAEIWRDAEKQRETARISEKWRDSARNDRDFEMSTKTTKNRKTQDGDITYLKNTLMEHVSGWYKNIG